MSSSPTWKRDANGVEHPTPETLLAFMREQCTEHEKSRINEHLLTGCVPCRQVRAGLTPSSNALDQLKYMSRYQYYPELQSNQVLLHAQRGEPFTSMWTGKRKRKFQAQSRPVRRSQVTGLYARKAGLRYMGIPAAFGIFLIFTMVVIALAYTFVTISSRSNSNGHPDNHLYNSGPNATDVAQHQPTITVPATITPASTVTVTVAQGPTISYCQPSDVPHRYSDRFIYICGRGFKAGDKVWLLLDYYGKNVPVIWWIPSRVNKLGEFTGTLYFYSCHNLPIGVYARDETLRPAVSSNILTNIPVAGCSGSTPTSTFGGR